MKRREPLTLLNRSAWRAALQRVRRLRQDETQDLLAFVICGMEHSGTTMLSDIFRQVPGLGAGWETGVLLADTPRFFPDVQPHFGYFEANWLLSPEASSIICDTDSFNEFYRRLADHSCVLPPGATAIFDKTPRYMLALKECLGRVSVPFVVTYKDPRAIIYSAWVRAGRPPFEPWLDEEAPERLLYLLSLQKQHQMHRMNRRVLFLSLEQICLSARQSCEAAFAHVGRRFDLRYLSWKDARYLATHGRTIQVGLPFEYRREWPRAYIRAVETRFAQVSDWFFE